MLTIFRSCSSSLLRFIPTSGLFERWHFDIVNMPTSKEGYKYLLTVICAFSRWPEAIPLKDQTAGSIAKALFTEIICRYGCPQHFFSDRAANFRSAIMKELSDTFGIHRLFTSSANPKANATVERLHSTIWQSLRFTSSKEQTNWVEQLPAILFAYRTSMSQHITFSPFFILFGKQPKQPLDLELNTPNLDEETNQETDDQSYAQKMAKI